MQVKVFFTYQQLFTILDQNSCITLNVNPSKIRHFRNKKKYHCSQLQPNVNSTKTRYLDEKSSFIERLGLF